MFRWGKLNSNKDEMPIIDHLDELRKRLMIVSVAHVIVLLLAFSQSGLILKKLMELNPDMHLIFVEPSEIMNVYIQIALAVAVAICFPFTLYHIWAFVAKGLFDNEKRFIKVALGLGSVFFLIGLVFAYYVLIPISLKFFTRIAIQEVSPMISVKNYISFILNMLITMGLVFNIPSLIYVATKLGIMTPSLITEYEKHLIVLIFTIAAIITPPDVISQCMVAIPMILLLRVSVFISKLAYKEKE